jgi:ATP-binding cassette subfamily C protein CydC
MTDPAWTATDRAVTAPAVASEKGHRSSRLWVLLRPYRRWIVVGATLGFLAIGSAVGLMAASAWLISKAALVTNVAEVALAVTAVRVLAISRAAFRYLERFMTHRASLRILADLRVAFYGAIEPLAPARLERRHSGDLLARIVRDVDSLEDLYVRVAVPPVVALLVVAFTALLLGAFDALLAAVAVGGLLVAAVAVPPLLHRVARDASVRLVAARAEADADLVETVTGMADLLAFGAVDRHLERSRAVGRAYDAALERIAWHRGLGNGAGGAVASLTGLVILVVGIGLVTSGRLEGVSLALVVLASVAAFEAVLPASQALQHLDVSRAAASRLGELVDAEPDVVDPSSPAPLPERPGVVVRGLRYRYGPEEPFALDQLDLEIPAGTSLALVGPSGSGKSTLVSLLLRFREYDEGSIFLGDQELRTLAAEDVRASLALVPQRIDLFDATVRDNLALADPGLTDERMRWACGVACVDEVIEALADGYDTRIGEAGVRLSGGERQRLAIARAVLRDAPIVILDEGTADLDEATERRVLDALTPVLAGRTVLFVTHRPSVASRADRVVVLRAPEEPAEVGR